MNIAVIGSGGREHALVWKSKQSPLVEKIYALPGNPGTSAVAENVNLNLDDFPGIIKFLQQKRIDLVVVGPEKPLVNGIADAIRNAGIRCFGPGKDAAMIEGSKAFAKDFMTRHGIPTANYKVFTDDNIFDAIRYLDEVPMPIVIKASGLAGGKGVSICENKERAERIIREILSGNKFSDAGKTIVMEEYLEGMEVSLFAITDGNSFILLPTAQDHKRVLDGDKGKNTGGMGAYSPAPFVTSEMIQELGETIIKPTIGGLQKEGITYIGCLYAGLIYTSTGFKVLEYNCRFGDPEAQVVLPLIDCDLAKIMYDASAGELTDKEVPFHDACAVCIVITSGGYPDSYATGKVIKGLENLKAEEGVVVFHAGTSTEKENLVSAGGRVLGVTAIGYLNDLAGTIRTAYNAVSKITFDGAYYRSDIGVRALNKTGERENE